MGYDDLYVMDLNSLYCLPYTQAVKGDGRLDALAINISYACRQHMSYSPLGTIPTC